MQMTHRAMVAALLTMSLASCQLERFFPDDVGGGAARLTVRNAVKLISFIDEDAACGMASERVKYGYRQAGETGETGTVTWTTEDCVLDFGEELAPIDQDC